MTDTGDERGDGALFAASVIDRGAFECLVRRRYPDVYRYLSRRVGPDLADDLAAETFEVAFRRRADFDPSQSTALPWLYGIAANAVRRHVRTEVRRWRAYARAAGRGEGADEYAEVDARLSAQVRARRVAGAVAALGHDQRDVVHLVALEGLSYQQAAAALNIPVGTVRSRLARARDVLRRRVGEDFELAERPSEQVSGTRHD